MRSTKQDHLPWMGASASHWLGKGLLNEEEKVSCLWMQWNQLPQTPAAGTSHHDELHPQTMSQSQPLCL